MPDESAIQPDAQETTGEENADFNRPLTPREQALARIDQMSNELVDQQNVEHAKANNLPDPILISGRDVEPVVEEPAAQEQPTEPAEVPQTVKVKVDGEELELPISEVIKGYQKDATASKRLELAAQKLREIEAKEQELATKAIIEPPPSETKTDEEIRTKATNIVNALSYGDMDSAINDLAAVLAARGNTPVVAPTIDPDQVTQLVRQTLTRESLDREFQDTQQWFRENHADLNDNPKLADMVNTEYSRALDEGLTPRKATEKAVSEVRGFIAQLTKSTAPNSQVQQQRETRKQTIDTLTPATGRFEQGTKEPDKPEDAIAEIRSRRWQQA